MMRNLLHRGDSSKEEGRDLAFQDHRREDRPRRHHRDRDHRDRDYSPRRYERAAPVSLGHVCASTPDSRTPCRVAAGTKRPKRPCGGCRVSAAGHPPGIRRVPGHLSPHAVVATAATAMGLCLTPTYVTSRRFTLTPRRRARAQPQTRHRGTLNSRACAHPSVSCATAGRVLTPPRRRRGWPAPHPVHGQHASRRQRQPQAAQGQVVLQFVPQAAGAHPAQQLQALAHSIGGARPRARPLTINYNTRVSNCNAWFCCVIMMKNMYEPRIMIRDIVRVLLTIVEPGLAD